MVYSKNANHVWSKDICKVYQEEMMNTRIKRVIYWSPRVISILFTVFISLFAMDVFGEVYGFWETILALLIHLVPVYILVIVLLLSWRWPWIGAVLYFGLAILYVILSGGRQHWSAYLGICLPLVVISVLWLVNFIYRVEFKKA